MGRLAGGIGIMLLWGYPYECSECCVFESVFLTYRDSKNTMCN
jgi:hypothetical protein